MAKNSIGQFISALRKANGMTQQEVADRLNVSNKAVSRWERDECAPDISLIPALAELLGVSCDELLRGERITEYTTPERKEQKTDKQVKALINRTLSSFKTLIWIALAVSAVGLILMFGISYGFYRPVIGFTVMLLFEACAFVLTMISLTRAKDIKKDNDIFELADNSLIERYNKTLGNVSFWSFYVSLSAIALSIPFIITDTKYINSVISPDTYFTVFLGIVLLFLIFIYSMCKAPYMKWICDGKITFKERSELEKKHRMMNMIQIGLILLSGALFVIAPWFSLRGDGIDIGMTAALVSALALLLASIIFFIVFIIKQKNKRNFMLSGIRNVFLTPAALIIERSHSVGWSYEGSVDEATGAWTDMEAEAWTKYDWWNIEFFWYAAAYCLAIFLIFSLLKLIGGKRCKTL